MNAASSGMGGALAGDDLGSRHAHRPAAAAYSGPQRREYVDVAKRV
ncbi:MAG TPA: hypothetical protein VGG59_13660 [Acidobacteriaceae bacterium]